MLDGALDRPVPHEAQVAVARLHGMVGVEPVEPGPVHVQLPAVEAVVTERGIALVDLGPEHVAVEGVRALPVRDGDHAVVDRQSRHWLTVESWAVTAPA